MAVDGHGPPQSSCAAWIATYVPLLFPTTGCFSGATIPTASTPEARDYNPVTNHKGCRATVQDIQSAVSGRRAQDSFARRALDNVGVQYGLEALNLPISNPGKISFSQFLDLNTRIGGLDIDGMPKQDRTRADPKASARAYRSGNVNDGRGLAGAAVIDLASSMNVEVHGSYHAYALEARMAALGHQDNHAIWHSGPAGAAFATLDAWLAADEADASNTPLPSKIKNNAPAAAFDSCWSSGTQQPLSSCAGQVFGDARLEAGMSPAHGPAKLVVPRHRVAKPVGHRKNPLPDGQPTENIVDQMRGQLRHPPAAAGGTEAPPLARERDENLVPAVVAAEPGEAPRHDTAREKLPELTLDEGGETFPVAAGSRLLQIRFEVLAESVVEHPVLGMAANVRAGAVVAAGCGSLPAGGGCLHDAG